MKLEYTDYLTLIDILETIAGELTDCHGSVTGKTVEAMKDGLRQALEILEGDDMES